MYRDLLVQQILPLASDLVEKLGTGTRVADVACGSGNGTVVMARRFPRSTFVGYDQDADAIAVARSRADGLSNVSFEVADSASLSSDQLFGATVVFNAVHDQARAVEVLASIRSILEPGAVFLMNEPRISSNLEDNIGNPLAPMTYAISLLPCMTVSLAEGGAGLGTGWGEQVARQLLSDAGFGPVEVYDAPGDPGNPTESVWVIYDTSDNDGQGYCMRKEGGGTVGFPSAVILYHELSHALRAAKHD